MRLLLIFVLSSWVFALAAAANENIHSYDISLSQKFSFDPYPDAQAEAVNALLLHIAEGEGKLRVRTSFGVHINLALQQERVHRDSLLARLRLEEVSISGDRHYKDFSLEKIMIPDAFSACMHIIHKQGDTLFQATYQNQQIDAPDEDWPSHVFSFQGDPTGLTVAFDNVSMHYKETMADRIARWRTALLSYYDASGYLDKIVANIDGLSPDDPNSLLLDEFKLCEAEALAGEILHAPFHQWFDLGEHDPEEIRKRFDEKRERIETLRREFNHAIANLDSLFYKKGNALVDEERWSEAREAFLAAVHYNPFHVPSHLALSEADLRAGSLVSSLDRLGHVMSDMQPLNAYDDASVQLADTLTSLFFEHASELIEADRLTSSLDTLEHVRSFCARVENHHPCPERLQYLIDISHRGIYRSFLTVARRAIRNDDVGFARMYVESALEYQERFSMHITEAFEARNLLLRVMTRQRVLADIALLGGDYDLSGDYRAQTIGLAADHPGLFDYVYQHGDKEQLKTAALNYAVAGLLEEGLSFLKKLRDSGTKASELSYHQRMMAAEAVAWLSNMQPDADPEELLTGLTARDPWFEVFDKTFRARWQQ